jgi:hypothetical protein
MPAVTTMTGGLHPVYFPDIVREETIDIIAQGGWNYLSRNHHPSSVAMITG